MWKPTYRIVLAGDEPGQALLQAWAVVDNTSGESWDDVQLSLDLGRADRVSLRPAHAARRRARRPERERASTSTRQVAFGERTFSQEEQKAGAGPAPRRRRAARRRRPRMPRAERRKPQPQRRRVRSREQDRGSAKQAGAVGGAPPAPAAPRRDGAGAAGADAAGAAVERAAQASAQRIAGLTRFDLPARVTLPDGSATMVPLVNQLVSGEQVFLYRPAARVRATSGTRTAWCASATTPISCSSRGRSASTPRAASSARA